MACAPRRPRRGETRSDSGSARVPVGREEEDSPDRQGPPVGESGREGGEADWTGRGEWADGAPWAAGRRKKKEKREMEGWPDGLETKRVRGKSFPFFSKRKTNTFKFKFEHKDSNSN